MYFLDEYRTSKCAATIPATGLDHAVGVRTHEAPLQQFRKGGKAARRAAWHTRAAIVTPSTMERAGHTVIQLMDRYAVSPLPVSTTLTDLLCVHCLGPGQRC